MPKTFISSAEREIRDAVVRRSRELWPDARIIHELNVEHGQVRADLAAVTPSLLILFEIKSERDKLHRLSNQLRHFGPVSHHLIVAAHEKWCSGSKLPNGDVDPIIRFAGHGELWRYPESTSLRWHAPYRHVVPWPHRMLRLLWTDELRSVAAAQGVAKVSRRSGFDLCDLLARTMPGAAVEQAVCAMLRKRQFAEADPPVTEEVAAA
ncbi:MAG TPA: hypothetical protein VFT69_17075 [Pseudolabrys sp.]|nr:hypothetical protein [Pseudolabrys sp.]